jgi:hypothetical protein
VEEKQERIKNKEEVLFTKKIVNEEVAQEEA